MLSLKNFVGLVGRVGQMTMDLRPINFVGQERKRRGNRVARLLLKARPIDRSSVQPRRRTRFQASPLQAQRSKLQPQSVGRRFAAASAGILLLANVRQTIQESTGSHNHRFGHQVSPILQPNPHNLRGRLHAAQTTARPPRLAESAGWVRFRATAACEHGIAFCRIVPWATRQRAHGLYSAAGTGYRPHR